MSASVDPFIVHIMYADLLFAFELHKARHNDLRRQAEEYRLARRSRHAAACAAQGRPHCQGSLEMSPSQARQIEELE
jgi:hypothetical protein